MKYKMLVLILLLTVKSWAQSATPSASSTPQQSTVPADQAKCACCGKMSARDTKAGATCCTHHNMEAKVGKEMASDKDAMSCPSAEIFCFDSEGVIEAGAVAFPCDRGTEFHAFRFSEFFPQAGEPGIRNINGRPSHAVGILKNKQFQVREVEVRTVVVQICDLLSGDAVCPACGTADVHSKRTSPERGNAEFGQSLQLVVDQLAAHL